mmetsp:Transcript_8742/g.18637  ORF Transcript_8742/g.18637 Transcript_8742/m.18637 type:complete len:399 (+) Transcript_8742:366-1562(+)|eukprot:CAMPEP_0202891952 /NCGR_PEP_ID=MMETSP1392-20130828/1850_1 /ASSEMBLY_ACC=CAM_ASM_000868 /TAXON_ID=225041 /ORGANISM="Chlamydomonas chlamydogama, Strain SAG 11-48b" /LENGTH=398 /DNA_ID=CAMNT_0049575825 /DNA_START=365 /DNA_END=1561 /DNA_ORIENTATION=-
MDTDNGDGSDVDVLPGRFADQAEWADVAPIVVDDGNCVVAIQYGDEHKEALSYFRAILASGEKSERALHLTEIMIGYNQADYTAWQYRWMCLEALNTNVDDYAFTDNIMQDNAKNYQLWNHRRKCALKMGVSAAGKELEFAAAALDNDEKNYHAWSHRQAIVKAFGLWESELEYVESMIQRDVRNNSAWNQRFFVLDNMLRQGLLPADSSQAGAGGEAALPPALDVLLQQELQYVAQQVQRAPRNESVWNYLRGVFTLPGCRPQELGHHVQVHTICREALADSPSCPPALAMLAEYYLAVAAAAGEVLEACGSGAAATATAAGAGVQPMLEGGAAGSSSEAMRAAAGEAVQAAVAAASVLFNDLMVADPIRSMYWGHRLLAGQALMERWTAALPPATA